MEGREQVVQEAIAWVEDEEPEDRRGDGRQEVWQVEGDTEEAHPLEAAIEQKRQREADDQHEGHTDQDQPERVTERRLEHRVVDELGVVGQTDPAGGGEQIVVGEADVERGQDR